MDRMMSLLCFFGDTHLGLLNTSHLMLEEGVTGIAECVSASPVEFQRITGIKLADYGKQSSGMMWDRKTTARMSLLQLIYSLGLPLMPPST